MRLRPGDTVAGDSGQTCDRALGLLLGQHVLGSLWIGLLLACLELALHPVCVTCTFCRGSAVLPLAASWAASRWMVQELQRQ